MQKKGKLLKTLICGGEVSLAVCDMTAVVNEAIRRHHLSPVAAAALGRTMSATAYLCSWLKEEKSSLSVTIDGDGVGGKICAVGDGALRLRGFVEHPDASLPPRKDHKLDVGGFVGRHGTLTVIRDDGDGIPFVGTSALLTGEIAEDFSAYFLSSEQRPTALALGVRIGTDGKCLGAGGIFFQPLPGASEECLSFIEGAIGNYSNISALIEEEGAESILAGLSPETPIEVREPRFKCHCSRRRISSLILSLGRHEAEDIIKERGKLSVYCHYCNTEYDFTKEDVDTIFSKEGKHEK